MTYLKAIGIILGVWGIILLFLVFSYLKILSVQTSWGRLLFWAGFIAFAFLVNRIVRFWEKRREPSSD